MTPLPAAFLRALEGHTELLVTSRDGSQEGRVRVWFVVAAPGVIYLFSAAFSLKARRWRVDPWIRLTIPGTGTSVEGVVHFVRPDEIDDVVASRVIRRWGDWGATHIEGLRRMIADGMNVLLRVEAMPESAGAGSRRPGHRPRRSA